MALLSFKKQIYEEFPITVDFSRNMAADETISTQTISAIDSAGEDATTDILSYPQNDGAQMAIVQVSAGVESLSPYKITFKVITSIGNKWEYDVKMIVKEL